MINRQLQGPDDKSVRTQITLSEKLKAQILTYAERKNQSLAEYLRHAAIRQIKADEVNKETLVELADRIAGSMDIKKYPEWSTKKKVIKWQKAMRAEW